MQCSRRERKSWDRYEDLRRGGGACRARGGETHD